MNSKPGTLVFIPSEVRLLKFFEETTSPASYKLTEKPSRVLMTEPANEEKYVGVFYEGSTWFVDEADITYGE